MIPYATCSVLGRSEVSTTFTISSSIQILELIAWSLRRWGGKEGLLAAMEKMKSELMLLGLASLILIAFQNDITSYCSKYLPTLFTYLRKQMLPTHLVPLPFHTKTKYASCMCSTIVSTPEKMYAINPSQSISAVPAKQTYLVCSRRVIWCGNMVGSCPWLRLLPHSHIRCHALLHGSKRMWKL